jgi:hypothetical protein
LRTLTILALVLSAASAVYGECVVIEPQLSSANIRLVARLDGKPAKDVRVDIFTAGVSPQPLYALVTDDKGTAIPPELAPGTYHIEAWSWRGRPYDLSIFVPPDGRVTPIEYSMNMESDESLRKLSADVKAGASPDTVLHHFAGVISDPSGASISGATIEVRRLDASGEPVDAQIQVIAGHDGKFSLDLADGVYVALFRSPGFVRKFVAFKIGANDPQTDPSGALAVSLEIGRC